MCRLLRFRNFCEASANRVAPSIFMLFFVSVYFHSTITSFRLVWQLTVSSGGFVVAKSLVVWIIVSSIFFQLFIRIYNFPIGSYCCASQRRASNVTFFRTISLRLWFLVVDKFFIDTLSCTSFERPLLMVLNHAKSAAHEERLKRGQESWIADF